MLRPTLFFIFTLMTLTAWALIIDAQAATVTGSFNKTYSLVNDTTQYINLTYLQSISNAYVEFTYTAAGGGSFDNSGGGTWKKWAGFTFSSSLTEYAQYKVVINGNTWELYNVTGSLEGSGSVTDFWSLVNSDGSDIRVFNQTSQLYFWLESWDYTNQQATIWVNVSSSSTELNIAYGNPSATASSYNDAGKVFEVFDDFEGSTVLSITSSVATYEFSTLDSKSGQYSLRYLETSTTGTGTMTGLISYSNPFVAEAWIKPSFDDAIKEQSMYLAISDTKVAGFRNAGSTDDPYLVIFDLSALTNLESKATTNWVQDSWYLMRVIVDSSGYVTIELYNEDGTLFDSYKSTSTYSIANVGFHIGSGSGQTGDAFIDTLKVYKLADPADVSGFSTGVFATPAQNPKLYLNNNLAASYSGELNETNPSSGKIAITDYWTAGNNSLYFTADSGNFDATVSFDFTLNVTEQREETFDYVKINTSFYLENGTTSATWQSSFTTSYNYSVKVYVNGAETSNFTLSETVNPDNSTTVTISVPISVNGSVSVDIYVNFVATGVKVTVLDELSKSGLSSITVQLLDKNYNLITESTTDANGNALIQTVFFGDAYLRARDANGITRQIEVTVPNGGNLSATIYFPTSNVVQVVFKLVDYTGQYSSANLVIKKYVSREKLETIHTDYFDAFKETQAYLIISEPYLISITNGVEERTLGWFTPSTSETKILEVRGTTTVTPFGEEVSWDFSFNRSTENNTTTDVVVFSYNDTLFQTEYVKFWVYGEGGGELYYSESNLSNVSFVFVTSNVSNFYKAVFEAKHSKYGVITDYRVFRPGAAWDFTFMDQVVKSIMPVIASRDLNLAYNLMSSVVLLAVGGVFSYQNRTVGVVVFAFMALLLFWFGFLRVPAIIVATIVVYAALVRIGGGSK
jgi:uncharacterized membrane protein